MTDQLIARPKAVLVRESAIACTSLTEIELPCEIETLRYSDDMLSRRHEPLQEFTYYHIGIAVKDLQEAIQAYKNLFSYKLTSGPFDDPIQNVSVCFLSRGMGDPTIELVAPLGPNSPVDRTLKVGGGPYHICYLVADIKAAIDHLTEQGSFLISGPAPAVAFEMREIAWLLTEVGLLVELVQAQSVSV